MFEFKVQIANWEQRRAAADWIIAPWLELGTPIGETRLKDPRPNRFFVKGTVEIDLEIERNLNYSFSMRAEPRSPYPLASPGLFGYLSVELRLDEKPVQDPDFSIPDIERMFPSAATAYHDKFDLFFKLI